MEYEDRVRIETPEGVDLELTLAGVGSRFVAALVDLAIQFTTVLAAAYTFFRFDPLGFGGAVFSIVLFLVIFGYDVLFEVFASGRTPGKRLTGLRVVRSGGQPVNFLTSAIRNVVRLIDLQPGFSYLVGIGSILATRRNQRLGDLAAGTLVVRERQPARARSAALRSAGAETVAWDVSAVTADDVGAVRSFLERRDDLEAGARADVARSLAVALRRKVGGAPASLADESFLEDLAAAKAVRS